MTDLTVTVAIPTRGDRPGIVRTIESILASANGSPFELLVVWSGHATLPAWASALPGEPRHILAPRLGLSVARNAALKAASGELILMPDDDVACSAGWFHAMVSALADGAGMVGGPVTCRWPHGRPTWMNDEMETIFASFDLGAAPRELVQGEGLVGPNMGMWRRVILSMGGYNTALGTTGRGGGMGEENDLCDRAIALGVRVKYVPDARVVHMIEAEAASRRNYVRRMYRFGRAMAIVRCHEGPGRTRKVASAAKRIVSAPFVADRMEQLGSAFFELGSVRASI